MARARNIKPAFFMNEKLGELEPLNRLLFIGLWCLADREGRLECRPLRIKASIFPYDSCDVRDMLNKLHSFGFIKLYKVNDDEYIQINKWAKHQNPHHKEIASVIPSPEDHRNTVCDGYIPLSNSIRGRIYDRDGRVCLCCGATEDLNIDHIIPVSKHGNSTDDNLQVLCRSCNVKKYDLIIDFKKLSDHSLRLIRSCFMQGSSMTQEQVNKIASYPTDSGFLIPDSLLLIPDISQSEDCSLSVDNSRKEKIPYQQILDMFHANCPSLSTVQILSDKRKSAIGSIWKMDERHRDMEFWRWYFQKIEASDFLTGRKKQGDWKADFDFTINKNKLIRIVEGTYDNR